jgi:hypothetical protein
MPPSYFCGIYVLYINQICNFWYHLWSNKHLLIHYYCFSPCDCPTFLWYYQQVREPKLILKSDCSWTHVYSLKTHSLNFWKIVVNSFFSNFGISPNLALLNDTTLETAILGHQNIIIQTMLHSYHNSNAPQRRLFTF